MRVAPEFIDSVAFLCERSRLGKTVPGGTAFFVELSDESDPTRIWTYLVTALHCLEDVPGREIWVRVNTLPNVGSQLGYEDISTSKDDWFKHWNADVAAIVAPYDPQRHAVQRIPLDISIDKNYRLMVKNFSNRGNLALEPSLQGTYPDGIPVEIGHEVFFPGLFVQSAGKRRNLPIVRFGNISRMPGEELVTIQSSITNTKRDIRAYLAECHSWGGHSGSPVFWHYEYNLALPLNVQLWTPPPPQSRLVVPQKTIPQQRVDVPVFRGWIIGFMGLVSAHFDIETKAKDKSRQTIDEVITGLNAGMAIVTPAENIKELLMSDEMKEDRRRRVAQMKEEEPVATADFAPPERTRQETLAKKKKDRIQIPIPTKGQFERDLLKATRKQKPSS